MTEQNKLPVEAKATISEEVQLVTFMLSEEEYGVEVLKVREIIRMPEITKMPNTPHWAEGIINLRGKVIPIVNLRRRFSLSETETDSKTRIIVMDTKGKLIGFIVDAVSEVIRIQSNEIQPTPAITASNGSAEFITGILNRENSILVLLDLDLMLGEEGIDAL